MPLPNQGHAPSIKNQNMPLPNEKYATSYRQILKYASGDSRVVREACMMGSHLEKSRGMRCTLLVHYHTLNNQKHATHHCLLCERQVLKYASDDSRVVREAAVGVIANVALKGPFSFFFFFFITFKPRVE